MNIQDAKQVYAAGLQTLKQKSLGVKLSHRHSTKSCVCITAENSRFDISFDAPVTLCHCSGRVDKGLATIRIIDWKSEKEGTMRTADPAKAIAFLEKAFTDTVTATKKIEMYPLPD